ncbi:MAG: hypothetical protein ABDI20_01475, partial [Candidatus Bipolaricaulaceae bacterium]
MFEKTRHTLTIAVAPQEAGTVNQEPRPGSDGKYEYCTTVTLTPVANTGYVFVGWGGTNASDVRQTQSNKWEIHITGDKTITANFAKLGTEQRTFGVGWNMVSVPLLPAPDNTPAAVFGDDVSPLWIWWWNPNAQTPSYVQPATIDPGRGYWIYLPGEKVIDVTGIVIDRDYEVPLGKAGWHMISTPTVNVYWGYCRFRLGNTVKTYSEAVNGKWISPNLYRWNPTANAYEDFTEAGVIEPWVG